MKTRAKKRTYIKYVDLLWKKNVSKNANINWLETEKEQIKFEKGKQIDSQVFTC